MNRCPPVQLSWRNLLASLAPGLVVLLGLVALWAATDGFEALTEEGARRFDVAHNPRPVPVFELEAMSGQTMQLPHSPVGNVSLVEFIYTTCPTICQTAGGEFSRLRDRLAEAGLQAAVRMVSVSFDPERDDPDAMRSYAELHGARGDPWTIARVARPDLDDLKQTFGIRVIADEWGGYQHNAAIHVIDAAGRLVAIHDIDDIEGVFQQVEDLL